LSVSTLREAEALLQHGVSDLFYAVELAPQKAPLVAELIRRGADLKCLVDSAAAARAIAERVPADVVVPLAIGLDLDGYRGGLTPDDPELDVLADFVGRHARLRLAGLMTYAGASYHTEGAREKGRLAERDCAAAVAVRERLERRGLACPMVSLGSTPAWGNATRLPGATELRGGIYVFQDLFQAGAGHCTIADVSLTVATTVIVTQPRRNRFMVDAGGLALSKDRSTAGHAFDAGYGLVARLDDGKLVDDWYVSDVHQEHGIVTSRSGAPIDFGRVRVGDMFRILPNHSDMTAAAYETYHVVRGDAVVHERWSRFNGWAPLAIG
jgi:D-serine deaminase-like pyridoxal phosphate-dependent protein